MSGRCRPEFADAQLAFNAALKRKRRLSDANGEQLSLDGDLVDISGASMFEPTTRRSQASAAWAPPLRGW